MTFRPKLGTCTVYICIVSFENPSIVSVCIVDRDIFAGISISLVNFSRSLNFVARLFMTKIGMGRRMLHKIFRVFNFCQKRSSTKSF